MRFYIASGLENAETVSKLAKVLTAAGHTHTYDWTKWRMKNHVHGDGGNTMTTQRIIRAHRRALCR